MPARKKKGKARHTFKGGHGRRPDRFDAPKLKEEVEPAQGTSSAALSAPAARPSPSRGSVESSGAISIEQQHVLRELKRIGVISGSIFLILILLSFLLP